MTYQQVLDQWQEKFNKYISDNQTWPPKNWVDENQPEVLRMQDELERALYNNINSKDTNGGVSETTINDIRVTILDVLMKYEGINGT